MDHESVSINWDADDNPLDRIAVSQLSTEIKDLVIDHVDTISHSNERAPITSLEPMLREIRQSFFSPATLYALLASRYHFQQESRNDAGSTKLWRTRWAVCEELSLSLIPEYDPIELAQCLVFEFYPLADGSIIESLPTWLRVSALESAIKSEAKRFLAHPVVVQIISELWDGHLVLDPLVHKVHRSENSKTKSDLQRLMNMRKGVVVSYDFEATTIFKPSRLRVPKYRDWIKLVNLGILISLYVVTMGPSTSNFIEGLFQVWSVSFIIDEISVLNAVGAHSYFSTLWSLCDFATVSLGTTYSLLSVWSRMSERPQVWLSAAYDILAICGVTSIPRVFSVLEASVGFSRTVISVRKMVTELLWCWIAITMFSVGFWAALAHFGKGTLTQTEVFYDLVQILFGFTPAVWQTWRDYPAPGAMISFLYLFMAQFVVTTIVTAALSAKVVETKDNSFEEYHFSNAVKAEVRIKSERQVLYFYSQPFNIFSFFPSPLLRAMLPTPWFLRTNRFLSKLTHWHVFLAIWAYERLSSAIISRREKFAELQQQRVAREVQGSISKRNNYMVYSDREDPNTSVAAVSKRNMRDTKFDLVEGLLNNQQALFETQQPSSSRAPAMHPPLRSRRRNPSFASDHFSSMISEDYIDLHEIVRDLQESNNKLEEMSKRVSQKLD